MDGTVEPCQVTSHPWFGSRRYPYAGEYGYHHFELGETGCEVVIEGCGDDDAVNYIQGVTVDDSCVFADSFQSVVNGQSTI